VLAQELETAGCSALGLGGTHGKVETAHPLLRAMESAEQHLARLARELELTPASAKPEAKRGRPPGRNPIEALGLGGLRAVK
jgi:phage terminase small subunit